MTLNNSVARIVAIIGQMKIDLIDATTIGVPNKPRVRQHHIIEVLDLAISLFRDSPPEWARQVGEDQDAGSAIDGIERVGLANLESAYYRERDSASNLRHERDALQKELEEVRAKLTAAVIAAASHVALEREEKNTSRTAMELVADNVRLRAEVICLRDLVGEIQRQDGRNRQAAMPPAHPIDRGSSINTPVRISGRFTGKQALADGCARILPRHGAP